MHTEFVVKIAPDFPRTKVFKSQGTMDLKIFFEVEFEFCPLFGALISPSFICNSSCTGFIQMFSLFYIFAMKIDPDFLPTKVLKVRKKWSRNRYEVVFEAIL
jgi:hypothetical protein